MLRARKCRGVEGRWDGLSYGEENWLYSVTRGYHPLVLLYLLFVDALCPTVWLQNRLQLSKGENDTVWYKLVHEEKAKKLLGLT